MSDDEMVYTIYGHVIDAETRAEVERVGVRAWLMEHPEADKWRIDALARRVT